MVPDLWLDFRRQDFGRLPFLLLALNFSSSVLFRDGAFRSPVIYLPGF